MRGVIEWKKKEFTTRKVLHFDDVYLYLLTSDFTPNEVVDLTTETN